MEEQLETRYCFMMLLAIADIEGDVIGTDVAIARSINVPLAVFQSSISALMQPDQQSNSKVMDGRRIVNSENGRGYRIVNYKEYRNIKTAEEKRTYMREYMRERRKANAGGSVANVNSCKNVLSDVTHAEAEAEAEGEGEAEPKTKAEEKAEPKKQKPKNNNNIPQSETAKRLAALFHRRETTPWSEKEIEAYKALGKIEEEDLQLLERYYATGDKYLRQNLATLLNNYGGELDRARAKLPRAKPVIQQKAGDPEGWREWLEANAHKGYKYVEYSVARVYLKDEFHREKK
jgi:hypothetical protein